jgi:hypothetical protein
MGVESEAPGSGVGASDSAELMVGNVGSWETVGPHKPAEPIRQSRTKSTGAVEDPMDPGDTPGLGTGGNAPCSCMELVRGKQQ